MEQTNKDRATNIATDTDAGGISKHGTGDDNNRARTSSCDTETGHQRNTLRRSSQRSSDGDGDRSGEQRAEGSSRQKLNAALLISITKLPPLPNEPHPFLPLVPTLVLQDSDVGISPFKKTILGVYLIILGIAMIILRHQVEQWDDYLHNHWHNPFRPTGLLRRVMIIVFAAISILIGVTLLLVALAQE
jgi:hypothetical protein